MLVRALPDWWGGQAIAGALVKLGWQPATLTEKIHLDVVRRNGNSLRNIWPQTKEVLLNDIKNNDTNYLYIENALYAFIGIGKKEIITELISLLNDYGNKTIAEAYLNCGSQELYDVGKDWANANGYTIYTTPGTISIHWGNM